MNENLTRMINQIGQGGTVKEGIFVRFPELIPAIGNNYCREDGQHGKLLLVGESNYFDDRDIPYSDFLDAHKWYTDEDALLIPKENERKKAVSNWIEYPTFRKVFNIMNKVLDIKGIHHEDGLGEAAFYNYFLRPAYNNGHSKGFKPQEIDKAVAGEALSGILQCISPDLVIFMSKLAYMEFEKYIKAGKLDFHTICITYVSHPASPWWNRNNGSLGKLKLVQLLQDNWIMDRP